MRLLSLFEIGMFRYLFFIFIFYGSLAPAATILIVGDSLSAAYGVKQEQGWVALAQARLADKHRIINASISGDTTAGAKNRLTGLLELHQPSLVVIELGGNDGLRALSLNQMKQNLASMIEVSRSHNARVLLLGVDLPPNYGPVFTQKFRDIYKHLSCDYNIPLVPSIIKKAGENEEYMQADRIHPNAKGQKILLEVIWPQLYEAILGLEK
jgi:acyl-CoA thioesterase-1